MKAQCVAVIALVIGSIGCASKAEVAAEKSQKALEAGGDIEEATKACDDVPVADLTPKAAGLCTQVKRVKTEIDAGKEMVTKIARDMSSAYDREQDFDPSGRTPLHKLCPSTEEPVPASEDALEGGSYEPTARDFDTPAWRCLKFSTRDKLYFQYSVEVADEKHFTVFARRKIGTRPVEISLKGQVIDGQVVLDPELGVK